MGMKSYNVRAIGPSALVSPFCIQQSTVVLASINFTLPLVIKFRSPVNNYNSLDGFDPVIEFDRESRVELSSMPEQVETSNDANDTTNAPNKLIKSRRTWTSEVRKLSVSGRQTYYSH
jgi:hypothetical protein